MTSTTRGLWVAGALGGLVALAALVAGSQFGTVSKTKLDPQLIAWVSAGVILVSGAFATTRISRALGRHVAVSPVPSAGGAVRIMTAAVGYLMVIFVVLAELHVSVERILVGAGLAGIVLGIAAQQSLGNVFAGLVLILAKPFRIGDHVRVRSGALGGVFEAWVREMSLTYVTLQIDDAEVKIPNSAMLAAGVGRVPPPTPGIPPTPSSPSGPLPTPSTAPGPANPIPAPEDPAPDTSP